MDLGYGAIARSLVRRGWTVLGYRARPFATDPTTSSPARVPRPPNRHTWREPWTSDHMEVRTSGGPKTESTSRKNFVPGTSPLVVLDEVHQYVPVVGRLCNAVRRVTGEHVWANAYVNSGVGGFEGHRDDHDVLFLGCDGERLWRVGGIGEVRVQTGTAVGIPEGTEHEASAPVNGMCAHVSLAFRRARACDLARFAWGDRAAAGPAFHPIEAVQVLEFLSGRAVPVLPGGGHGWDGPLLFRRTTRSREVCVGGHWTESNLSGVVLAISCDRP
jgi:hypothetical protein